MIAPRMIGDGECILVTGGLGFIGSHLVEALLGRGCRVLVLDDLSGGCKENLASAPTGSGLEIEIGSVNDRPVVESLVSRADLVYHLAAVVGSLRVVEDPVATIRTNLFGTGVVLGAAVRYDRPVIFTSTSEVYGHSESVPFHEDLPTSVGAPGVPRWSYATAKVAAEQLALAHAAEDGLRVVIPRIFNTVGQRQRASYGMVVPRFVEQVLGDDPITVFGDGHQTRCFADVSDVVEALIALGECPSADGLVVNIGSTEEVEILELAEMVREMAREHGFRPNGIRFVPYEEVFGSGFDDPTRRLPATDRIEELTGWRPRQSLDMTLRRVFSERIARIERPLPISDEGP
jgi:UDP-glucose 4-epimerase